MFRKAGWRLSMKVGDLIYDSHYGQHGLVIEISPNSEFCTVFYEDGQAERGIRPGDIEVISASR